MQTKMNFLNALLAGSLVFFMGQPLLAGTNSVVIGNVRVQLLSDSLVRLEQKGPAGFEDRNTFHIVNRNWLGVAYNVDSNSDRVEIRTASYTVRIPQDATSLDTAVVLSADGQTLYTF